MAKFVAVFGSVSISALKTLKEAGFTVVTTDGPAEEKLRKMVAAVEMKQIIRAAAWTTLDHRTSEVRTDVDRFGEPRDYNRNGGFTRDWLMVEEAHAVIVGSGVMGARLANIQTACEDEDKPLRAVVDPDAEPTQAAVDPEEVAAEFQDLAL